MMVLSGSVLLLCICLLVVMSVMVFMLIMCFCSDLVENLLNIIECVVLMCVYVCMVIMFLIDIGM